MGVWEMQKPNVLLVITHDTGRHLGCYGREVDTPNLDRLAAEGLKFTKAFCTAPQCSPSRASLLTGMMPHRHGLIGLTHRGFRLKPQVPLLPALLSEAGYTTALFGFQHEAPEAKELGYQQLYRPEDRGHSCLKVTPLLLDFLSKPPPQPFFAMVGFSETHRPFPQSPQSQSDSDSDYIKNIKVPLFLPDEPEVRRDILELNQAVKRVDTSIGQILGALQKAELSENTLFLYTTDHGIAFPGAKATLFEPGLEIALLLREPASLNRQRKRKREVEAMISNADLAPTILELCGLPIPDKIDGKSLLPLIQEKTDHIHERLFFEQTYHAAYDPMRGLRTERFKYIRSFELRPWWLPPNVDNGRTKEWFRNNQPEVFRKPRPAELLFDLRNDLLGRQNLSGNPDYSKVLEELRQEVEHWMRETDDPLLQGPVSLPQGAKTTPPESWNP